MQNISSAVNANLSNKPNEYELIRIQLNNRTKIKNHNDITMIKGDHYQNMYNFVHTSIHIACIFTWSVLLRGLKKIIFEEDYWKNK